MSQKRRGINARMPEPNDNFSMTVGNKVIVDAVFRDTGLDGFLDGLKRNQGESVSNEIKALVANSTFILESTCHRYGAARCTFLPFCASLDDYPHELT